MSEAELAQLAAAVALERDDPSSRDAQWCLEQYFQELDVRFKNGFDPDLSVAASNDDFSPPRGCFIVARLLGQPVGCGALRVAEPEIGEIKRMWVAPRARGRGIGRKLLAELERSAHTHKVKILRLETNESLQEAHALYRSAGFAEVEPFNGERYAHHWFQKRIR